MLNDDLIESERSALQTIHARCTARMGGPAFSPLENIDGTNPVIKSIYDLMDSPLCWPGMLSLGGGQQADRILESLGDLYERAVLPWERFRTVQSYMLVEVTGESDHVAQALPIYARWPDGTFPAKIQRGAKDCFWLLRTTSRFSVEDIPSKWGLESVSPAFDPLTFGHMAGMAAVVCITRALEQHKRILSEWVDAVREKVPEHSFEWLMQNDPVHLERLLAEHVSSRANGYESEWAARVAMLLKNAEAWLELVNTDAHHQFEIERTTRWVERLALDGVKAENSTRARNAAKAPRSAGHLTAQMVANYFNERPGIKILAARIDLAVTHGVHESTVARRHREAIALNLIS